MSVDLERWAEEQRALARAVGLSIEEWIMALEAASQRQTGLTAAVIGAAMARGLGMGVLDQLDPKALAQKARTLVDPTPPRVDNPILKEAIRRGAELGEGRGLARLKKKPNKPEISTPQRGRDSIGRSATTRTPDAPGEDE